MRIWLVGTTLTGSGTAQEHGAGEEGGAEAVTEMEIDEGDFWEKVKMQLAEAQVSDGESGRGMKWMFVGTHDVVSCGMAEHGKLSSHVGQRCAGTTCIYREKNVTTMSWCR